MVQAESKSRKATIALVLAVISLVAAPALLWAELIVLYLGGWISSEPGVQIFVVAIVIVVICLALLIVFALPVAALLIARRARREITAGAGSLSGSGNVKAAQIIAGITVAALLIGQVYFALMAFGICSFDGCS